MKALFVHAHFDDYEFAAAGTFEMWRRRLGGDFRARLVICTDGAAGHHRMSREETARVRLAEQMESAKLAQCEVEPLRLPNGRPPREACLQVDSDLLAALWKAIRDFEPDYLFAPPMPSDSIAGLHVDHVAVAEAVRKVAYMINVPHAFTPEYPSDEGEPRPCKVPVILTAYDSYMFGANSFDLAVDVSAAFKLMVDMTWCHQSQVTEWLPWVGRHDMAVPKSREEWRATLEHRYAKRNRELGLGGEPMAEVFGVTAWGEIPTLEQLKTDLPNLITPPETEARLAKRLAPWRGGWALGPAGGAVFRLEDFIICFILPAACPRWIDSRVSSTPRPGRCSRGNRSRSAGCWSCTTFRSRGRMIFYTWPRVFSRRWRPGTGRSGSFLAATRRLGSGRCWTQWSGPSRIWS